MWLALAFVSAALLGLYDVSKKQSLRDNAVIPVLLLNTLFCSLFFLPLIVGSAAGIIGSGSPLYVPPCPWEVHRYILLKAVIVLSSWILGYLAMKHLPLSIVGPVNATRPVMTLVGALLIFNETLNGWQWAGVLLAIVSFFMLGRSSRKEGIRFAHNRYVCFLVGAALLGALSGLYDKFLMSPTGQGGAGLDKMAVQSWYNIYQCIFMSTIAALLYATGHEKRQTFHWRWPILLISVFLTLADVAYFYALSFPDAMISVVSMVRRSSVLVSFACAALLFHEKNLHSKAVDLLLVLLGMVCLWIGTTP